MRPMPGAPHVCKDCKAQGLPLTRAATQPGPRCHSHHVQRKRELRLRQHSTRVATVYGLTDGAYWALYEAQDGRCAICRRAQGNPTGRKGKRNLAVDHDHSCCAGKTSCGKCVRGLVCGPCNDVLAHFRDDPDLFARGAAYLVTWPSRRAGIV